MENIEDTNSPEQPDPLPPPAPEPQPARFVTYQPDGALTGCFLQVPTADQVDCMILVDEAIVPAWPNYRANEARDGLEPCEPAPQVPFVPPEVTMRQARLALLRIGALDKVASAIESLEGVERDTARIEWEFSSTVNRHRQLVVMLGHKLGLDDDALDQLFITAATL